MAKDHAKWLMGVLPKHEQVAQVECVGAGLLRIHRKEAPPVIVGVISANPVRAADCEALLAGDPRPQFVVNIPKAAPWEGGAIDNLESQGVAWGKMSDLYRGLNNEDDLSDYRNPSLSFIERLFHQHKNVVSVERVSDQAYRLHRTKGDPVVVALTDAYEVTADVVRTAYDTLSPFDVLLKNNPYGRISQLGHGAAAELGVRVCDQSTIFGHLAA